MFEIASSRFCESIGKDTLHPVPSYDQAKHCQLYSVVRKEKHNSTKYEHLGFSIDDLLDPKFKQKKDDVLTTKESSTIAEWKQSYDFRFAANLDGIVGTLMALFTGQISTNDEVVVKTDFKHVKKDETNLEKLLELLEKSKLNLNHSFIKQVKHDHNVLCLIYGVWYTGEESTITSKLLVKVDEEASGNAEAAKANTTGGGNNDVDVDYTRTKTLTIPKDVPMAFEAYELIVDSVGNMTLAMGSHTAGGFIKHPFAEKGGN